MTGHIVNSPYKDLEQIKKTIYIKTLLVTELCCIGSTGCTWFFEKTKNENTKNAISIKLI